MKNLIIILALLAALCGCDVNVKKTVFVDQCLRRELFNEFLKNTPKGPDIIGHSNDWDDVVSKMSWEAYHMSKRNKEFIKPDCMGDE